MDETPQFIGKIAISAMGRRVFLKEFRKMNLSPTYCSANSTRWNLIHRRVAQKNGSVVLNCHWDDYA